LRAFPHETVVGGDSLYPAISAASILAKVSRDAYIEDLCEARPELKEKYGLHKNMGYGTKQHIDGIITHGITDLHRRTFTRKWAGAEAPTEKEV
jgi:ribonuclease HII